MNEFRYLGCCEKMNDEFYIGWEDKVPSAIGKNVRNAIVVLLSLVVH